MSDLIRLDDAIEAFLPAGGIHWVHRSKREIVTILRTLPTVTVQAQIDAAREAALQDAISHVRQALIDDAHKHGSIAITRSSAMFTAEIIATNALSRLLSPAIRKGDQP